MFYITHTPWWLRSIFPKGLTWQGDPSNDRIYLTFDDGPHPEITAFVMEQLETYQASGTFFCIGENVERYPEMLHEIRKRGHRAGNHTFTHPNGWKMSAPDYLQEIKRADELIGSDLFRPPYGKITTAQANSIRQNFPAMKIIMWSCVTGDFDTKKTGHWCATQAKRSSRPGAIIVFHDSEKAWPRLRVALPEVLRYIQDAKLQTGLL